MNFFDLNGFLRWMGCTDRRRSRLGRKPDAASSAGFASFVPWSV